MSNRRLFWWGLWLVTFVAVPLLLTAVVREFTANRFDRLVAQSDTPRPLPVLSPAPAPISAVEVQAPGAAWEPAVAGPVVAQEEVLEASSSPTCVVALQQQEPPSETIDATPAVAEVVSRDASSSPVSAFASIEIHDPPELAAAPQVGDSPEPPVAPGPEQAKVEMPEGPVSSEVALPTPPAAATERLPAPARRVACPRSKCRALAKAAASSHKALYFDNDFSYLHDPCYGGHLLGDALKQNALACGWAILDIGGEYRLRHHSERNMRGLGLTGLDDDFLLQRTRLYANVEVGSRLRVYAEMIDAVSTGEQFAPRPIEEDRANLHNLFADYYFSGDPDHGLGVRLGRQELLYGAQRTVSPLDWANTRRTFEGYKAFWRGDDWNIDAFWTRPVPPRIDRFDTADQSQQFMGLYSTCKAAPGDKLDLYYLRLVETDGAPNFDFHTLGTRWEGRHGPWLAEIEAAVQFGSFGALNHTAGAYTLGLGRKLGRLPWNPTLWAYYDWASGDATIGNGYHHLFPLAHKYLGWMDLYGRRNIEDLNFLLTLQPRERLRLLAWWHILHRQNAADVPYNVNMSPFVATPGGSGQLGQELDLLAIWTVGPRAEFALGYSHFFTGAFYRTNPTAPYAGDADFVYTQLNVKF